MATPRRHRRPIGIGLLLVLLAFVALMIARQRLVTPQTGQADPVVIDQIAQLPTVDSPLPTVIIIGTIAPTATPLSTFTPWPTPTLRAGPTATPLPLKTPPTTAAGYLLYSSPNANNKWANDWITINIDEAGQVISDSKRPLADLDSSLAYAQPSPSGKYIAFVQPGVAGGVPYIYETQTNQTWPLFRNEKLFAEYNIKEFDQIFGLPFGWHPSGQQLLFWSATSGYAGLWLANVETSQRTIIKLISNAPQGASVSPDGQRVAFAINDGDSTHLEVAYTDGSQNAIIPNVTIVSLFDWSPDGKWLLFSGNGSDGDPKQSSAPNNGPLWIMNIDTFESRSLQIPFITNWPFDAKWSPSGQSVVAVGLPPDKVFRCADKNLPAAEVDSCQYQGVNIYTEDIVRGEMHQIATGIRPVWSPNGAMIAFLSIDTGNPEIWTVRTDGSDLQQITADGQWKWSYLAWVRAEGGIK